MIIKSILLLYLSLIYSAASEAMSLDIFVEQYIDQKIKPDLNEFETQTERLRQSTINHCQSQTDQTLLALKESWVNTYLSWKKIQLFGFGPTGSLRVERRLDFWPTRISKIKKILLDTDAKRAFQNSGVSARGFPAIEWLIFKSEEEQNKNYCELLHLLSRDILEQTQVLNQAWQSDLIKLNGSNDLQLNTHIYSNKPAEEFINAMVVGIYAVRKKSLITPMGFTTGFIDTKRMEASNSKLSTITFKTRLQSIIEFFDDDQIGLISWLETNKNKGLAKRIKPKVESIKNLQSIIGDNFANLIQNKDESLIKLESQMNDLQFIIEEDLSTHFNLIMFFKDLDGD